MARGRDRWLWNHTSEVLAMLLNVNPWRKGRAIEAAALNPYRQGPAEAQRGIPITPHNLELLAKVFCKPTKGAGP